MEKEKTKSIFDNFTRQYSLSKTLRFELKPIGKTRENMNANLEYDENLRTFLADQKIEDAYQILKPVFDKIHEEFITKSLESAAAKEIDFSEYFNLYKKQKNEQNKDERKKLDKLIQNEEKKLRKEFEKFYLIAGEEFKIIAGKDSNGKDILKKNGYKVLTEAGILAYIKNKLLANPAWLDDLKIPEVKVLVENKEKNKEKVEKALEQMKRFFTYFGGFNQNRENYYDVSANKNGEGKSTAVATRVIEENLPKFADNLLSYEKNKDEYDKVFLKLQNDNKELRLRNPRWDGIDKNTEFIPAYDIKNDGTSFAIGNFVNCFSQSEIDAYNAKVANVNYLVNLYYQQTKNKLPKFKILFKQIGCGEKKDFIKLIKNNAQLKAVLEKAKLAGEKYLINDKDKDAVGAFMDYLLNLDDFKNIYWSDKAMNTISGKYFGNWGNLKDKLLKAKVFNKDKNSGEAKIPQAVSLSDLFEVLDAERDWQGKGILFRENFKENNEEKQDIIKNSRTPHDALLKMICKDIENLAQKFVDGADEILKIKEGDYQKDESKIAIKTWLDSALFVGQILKYWRVKARFSVDSNFTDILDKVKVSETVQDYDVVRNYLTQKPQNKLGRLKLNFENSTLAGGWDVNKEKDNACLILQDKKGKQYLVVTECSGAGIFEQTAQNSLYAPDASGWTKMNYKLIPGPNKMLPKVLFFSSKWIKANPTPDNIKTIYEKGTFKKGDNFSQNDLHALIDFYKDQLKKYPLPEESWNRIFDFDFSDTKKYKSIDQFYTEVERQGYKIEFVPINKGKIDELVEGGRIYLFEIKSKDSNLKNGKEKTSAKDLQTIYWNEIFGDAENKPKLNGGAEIFYRSALEEADLKKKNWKNKEIIENFRFSKEKFILHCPITLNPCLKNNRINDLVNKNFAKSKNQLFLGIDRGEKHLAYYSLVNRKGQILEQGSFNTINGQDYWDKLDKKQGDRDEARKNWTTIGNIKDLKDGYISQVVRKIVDLAVYNEGDRKKGFRETPAFIVLEDLNIGFKRGRQKIEKQVYQKLELALAKKLNFLVDKNAKVGEMASVDNALQFTPAVREFSDIKGKQFGIMLYTNPSFTSKTDPITGWRQSIFIKKGSVKYIQGQIMGSFSDFGFNGKDYYFGYEDVNTGKEWTLYSGKNGRELDRYRDKFSEKEGKKHWNPEKIEIVKKLEKIFDGFDKNKSFKEQIKSGKQINKIDEHTAWESLRFTIDVIQQIRNTGNNEKDNDFILSPVMNDNGDFFDSRDIKDNEKFPQNGDGNGAYNIACKGIIMSEHIKRGLNLFIRSEEWDAWLAGEKIWEKYIAKNLKIRKKVS